MSYLDGFERYVSTSIRPPRGHRRVSVSSKQITFSKELVMALGSPKRVSLYLDKPGKRIAIKAATHGGVRFAGGGSRGKKGRKDEKVLWKNPDLVALFQGYLDPIKSGMYDCIDAKILEDEKVAVFGMNKSVRYETDERTLEKLKNGRMKKEN